MNNLVADFIFLLHLSVIAFTALAPFSKIPLMWLLHINLVLCMMVHWYFNSNACSLTIVESALRGVEHTNTFMHQLVSPVYNISEYSMSKLIWVITTILLFISIYKVFHFLGVNDYDWRKLLVITKDQMAW